MLKIFILIFVLLFETKFVYAFLSPNTISTITSAIGSFFWTMLVITSVYIIIFLKVIKKNIIKHIFIFFVILAIAIVFSIIQNNILLNINEIDLYSSETQLSDYKIFQLLTVPNRFMLAINGTLVSEKEIFNGYTITDLFNNVDKFVAKHKITKEDTLLFCCAHGGTSKFITLLFNLKGYKAYFARETMTIKNPIEKLTMLILENTLTLLFALAHTFYTIFTYFT